MDENGIITFLPVILSLIGIILDQVSFKRSDKLIQSKENCEEVIIEKMRDQFRQISDFYHSEIDRVLALAFNPEVPTDIEIFELKEKELIVESSTLRFLKQANKYINKVETALFRMKLFRWIFVSLLILTLTGLIISFKWPSKIPDSFFDFSLGAVILVFLWLIFDQMVISNLLSTIREKYGLSI